MYVHVKPTRKLRVLSFILSIVLLWSAIMQNLVVFGVVTIPSSEVSDANSADDAGSSLITQDGTYTGNYLPSAVTLFDYYSDNELKGQALASTASGFYDPYTILNKAISTDVTQTPDTETITFRYKPNRQNITAVNIHLFDNSNHSTTWPGYAMNYDVLSNEYTLTLKYSDIKNRNTNTHFAPTAFIINGHDTMSGSSNYFQTDDVACSMSAGNSYLFSDCVETKNSTGNANKITVRIKKSTARIIKLNNGYNNDGNHLASKSSGTNAYKVRVNIWDDNNHSNSASTEVAEDGDYWTATIDVSDYNDNFYLTFKSKWYYGGAYGNGVMINVSSNSSVNAAETDIFLVKKGYTYVFENNNITSDTIFECKYPTPLYFGAFVRENDLNPDMYTAYNKPSYQNFYWKANISQRTSKADTNSAVQNLINSELTGGQITQGTGQNKVTLPYFDTSWSKNSYTYHDDNTNTDVTKRLIDSYSVSNFPFYEVKFPANSVNNYSGSGSGNYAKYYQFNAKETNVYYNKSTGKLSESGTAVQAQGGSGHEGFFPFNNLSSTYGVSNNLGFGAKFEIKFNLSANGKTATQNSAGQNTEETVPMIFEFKGDDDVWVFIDNKLVLDLGGAHGATYGYIDFANDEVVATKAIDFATGDKDALNLIGAATTPITVHDKLKSGTASKSGDQVTYTGAEHTLTMFYMERGMFDSNMLVRYNFGVKANTNTMTIKEETNFDGVNPGLKNATMRAADNDVFRYTVSNSGTTTADVTTSGIQYPTYDRYDRKNTINGTTITTTLTYTNPNDLTHIYLDTSKDLDGNGKTWDENKTIAAYLYDGSPGKTVLMNVESEHLYKVDISGYARVQFLRLPKNVTDVSTNVNGDGFYQGTINSRYKLGYFQAGATYKITDYNSGLLKTSTPKVSYDAQVYDYDPDTNGATVKNTTYMWEDGNKDLVNDLPDGRTDMTGKTDDNGALYLMYGTSGKESSATFVGQFKKDPGSGTRSTMTISQDDDLYKHTNSEGTKLTTSSSAASRTVHDYYTTKVTVKDSADRTIDNTDEIEINELTTSTNPSFYYANGSGSNATDPVQLTETFENSPQLGAITITKSSLSPSDTTTDTFPFNIHFSNIFGTNVNITSEEYTNIEVTYSNPNSSGHLQADGQFTLSLGQSITISGIPVGTHYEISESADNYEPKSTSTGLSGDIIAGVLEAGETTYNNPRNYSITNSSVVVNTRLLGTLELKKALTLNSSQKLNGSDIGDTTPFTYKVTLESPNETNYKVKLSDYISGIKRSDYDAGDSSTHITLNHETDYKYNFTVNVSKSSPITIVGIPYGTTYTVRETTTGPFTNDGPKNGTVNKTTPAASATITNTTPNVGSLTLTKSLQGDYSSYIDTDTKTYTLNAVLTPNGYNLSDFIRSADLPSGVTFNSSTNTITAVVNYSNPSVTIGNIPYGTKYTVSEVDANTSPMTTSYDYQYNTHSTDGIQAATQTATVTNTYPGSLTIRKSVAGGAPTTLPDYFIMDVTFNFPDSSQHTLSAGTFQHGTSTEVSVPKNGSIKITGIPLGTTYTIQEDKTKNSLPSNLTIGGQVTTAETINVGSPAADKTITNTYPAKGSLVLTKTRTGNAPTTAMDYYVDVTFTPNHGENLRHYLTAIETYRQSDYVYRIPVSVAANSSTGSFTINDIPTGTDYSVSEYTTGPFTTAYSNNTGTTNDSQTAVGITNTYQYLNTLTLNKEVKGESATGAPSAYTFDVTLTSSTLNLENYNITVPGVTLTSSNYSDNGKTCTFSVNVTPGTETVIRNIPYDTQYSVVEDRSTLPSGISVLVTGEKDADHKGTISATASSETITNTYLGTLTLNKALATGSPASADTTDFDFQVKLIPPSGVTLSNYTLTDSSSSKNSANPDTFNPDAEDKFTVKVQKNKPVTISGIPFGTQYTIEEINKPSNVNVSGEVAQLDNKKVDATHTAPSETIINTYLGSLKLQKTRNGEIPSTPPSSYQFNVTLKEPNGVTLTNYNALSSYTVIPSGTPQKTYSFSVNVAPGGEVSIPNLPYGTEYTVEEAGQASLPTNTIVAGEVKTSSPETIDAATETVNIINTYPGSLELKKKLEGTLPPEVTTSTPFTFNVTLTNTDKSSFKVKVDGTEKDVTSGTLFTVNTVTSDHSVKITEIPVGTTYLVTEAAPTPSPDSTTGNMTEAVEITASDATKVVEITNTYSYTPVVINKSITLTKTDLNSNPLSGVTFALLKLNSSAVVGNSDFASSNSGDYSGLSSYYDAVYGTKTTDASGRVTFTEGQDGITTFATGDRYFFYEVSVPAGSNIIIDNSLTDAKIITISDGTDSYNTTYKNSKTLSSVDVTVKKVDESDPTKGLEDAEFELWYKDSTVHPTYTFNDPLTAPLKTNALKVSGTGITVPAAAAPSSYTTYDYTYTYDYPSTPSATETEWILPRTDNDYIYFRDFESGTADHDPGLSKHAWLDTSFEINTYSQEQEINYTHNYWVAAQFTKNGSDFVEYAVWERFVDRYSGFDTVVWKIQPPDGYNKVRFCLYDGSNCIRTTEEFEYQLGKIYKKTSWGDTYRYQNNNHCYFNVPVDSGTNWSTYYTTASTAGNDQRNANTTNLNQAERYTPTEQKIIFHCNSQQVWHNIHIEFFDENQDPIHQQFPGYMMEPYAYAGSDYRLSNGYLTYELTIPNDAHYFRINNGVDINGSSPYAYRTEIKALNRTGSTKNYGNYFILGTDINTRYDCLNNGSPREAVLTPAQAAIIGLSHESTSASYSSNEVESDSDYIYFARKNTGSGWNVNAHVYAYFYGGGNLREDNWQRACYSIWPGVAPVGTQFNDGSDHNSTIYGYTPSANPESTFEITKGSTTYTVYKFRMPEGDRKNYSKVIFNDGLNKINSGSAHETSPITYNAGYIYFEDGGSMQHFDNYSTIQYTKRGGANDYLYIKTAETAWDDMHITFYRSDGSQIHQSGTGYVMKYAGTSGGETYYRIPIPADAAKFKLNNGRDKATSLGTDFGDILRYSDGTGEGTNTDYTKGKIVYTLTNPNTLSMVKLFNETQTNPVEHTTGTQDSKVDYTKRGDYLYIRNTANWNIGAGGGQVKFYDSTDALITGNTTGGNGTYILIQTVNDDGDPAKEWYSIDIPDDAVSFTLTYNGGANTTARNPIYPLTAGADGNYTEGNMYYQTTSGGALSLMTTTVSPATSETDITAAKRSDTLYLLCTSKTEWENMTVTFLNSSGTAISGATGIEASYIAEKDGDHWWSISIPTGAASFTVTDSTNTNTTEPAEIYPLSQKLSRYKKDYTLGDMQYRLPAPAASSKPGLLYPIFTQDDEYTLEVGGKTITTSSGTALVDESAIAAYAGASSVTTPATTGVSEPTSPYPVLYSTTTDNLSYSWTDVGGTNPNYNYVRFRDKDNWNNKYYNSVRQNLTAYFFGGSGNGVHVSIDHSESDSGTVYYFAIPNGNHTKVLFTNRWDGSNWNNDDNWSDSRQTCDIELIGYGHGYAYEPLSNDNYNSTTPKKVNTVKIYDPQPSNSSSPLVDDTYFYAIGFYQPPGQNNNMCVAYFDSSNNLIAEYQNKGDIDYYTTDGSNWYNRNYHYNNKNYRLIYFYKPYDYSYAIVYNGNNYASCDNKTNSITKSDIDSHKGYAVWYSAHTTGTPNVYTATWVQMYNSSHEALVAPIYPVVQNISDVTHTAAYQPEDRYGFITSRDDYSTTPADTNNFIYIDTTISDPYITFYDSDSNAIGGNNMADAGIKLKGVCGNSASPYKIRLPRNAKSFNLADGASGTLGSAVHLEETIYVKTDRTITNSSDTSGIEMTNYRHAGTTFNAVSTTNVTVTTLRSGFTISRETALSETSPKSDVDYVFFTDTSNTIKGSDGTVYAYFYGDADGEFAHWPGIQAESSYTDNAGKTVYRFRIPKDTNGTYAKVIFNNGSDVGRKITQAVNAAGGKNYTLDTSASTAQYGTVGTNAITAYAVADSTKATATNSAVYGSNKYIYIYNNGTQNLTNGVDTGRYTLDEMHVIFYDINNAPIGSADSGYIPDKLSSYPDYYRMQVPNGAVYFQITNGTGKGTGSNYYSRQSEIKQITANGLYKFVDEGTNAADYITADSTVPTGNNATREAPKYLLTLKNEKKAELDDDVPETSTFDVKLAVVVTGSNGQIDHIKWLKQKNGEVDQAYLNHTNADVGEGKGITTVKVVKNGTYYWKEVVAPAGYELNENIFEFIKTDSTLTGSNITGGSITVTDKKISGKVILTKTAKEKVGTTNIGDTLAGAQFKLVKVNGNSEDTSLRFTLTTVEGKNTYSLSSSSASYNNIGYWLTTGSDGKLTIEGLSPGDYYLEEQTAPAGFVATDSNNVVNGTAQKKKVYFSIGDNTTTKYLTCSDEMAPAYIKLYEHINEKLPAWGDPTFIFKITKSGGKTSYVALTVDDNGGLAANEDDTILGTAYNAYKYIESTDELEGESPNQTLEYQGMYHIDNQGRIRLEPGTYSITRVPVSRYEFVADTFTDSNTSTFTANTTGAGCATGLEAAVSVTVNEGDTAIVHYYDKVAYYDKFSHVDEEINKFYTLDASKNNTTAKGIRVEYKPKVPTTGSEADINITNNDNFKAWFINVDGTERAMNDTDKAKLDISCLPADNNSADTSAFQFQTPTIKISTPSNFKDKVYTLTAEYKENNQTKFTTTFDLVFARS